MAAMTWPINVAEELRDAQLLDELSRPIDYASLVAHQLAYKHSLLRAHALRPIFQLMSPCIAKSRRDRTPKDESVILLVLQLVRNLAALQDRPASARGSADEQEMASLQSDFVVQLSEEGVFDLLLAIGNQADSTEFGAFNMIALDIFHLVFRAVRPAELLVPFTKVGI